MLTKSKPVPRLLMIPVLMLALAVGIKFGIDIARLPHAYETPYMAFGAWVYAGVVTGIGLLLCFPRYTRYGGMVLIVAGGLLLISFYGTFLTLRQMGKVKWNDPEPMVSLGPDVRASLLVYFKYGISNNEIESFTDRTFHAPERRGHSMRKGLGRFLRLPPVQGHEGVAVDFTASASPEQRREIIGDVLSDPSVYRILTDTVPLEVVNLD